MVVAAAFLSPNIKKGSHHAALTNVCTTVCGIRNSVMARELQLAAKVLGHTAVTKANMSVALI